MNLKAKRSLHWKRAATSEQTINSLFIELFSEDLNWVSATIKIFIYVLLKGKCSSCVCHVPLISPVWSVKRKENKIKHKNRIQCERFNERKQITKTHLCCNSSPSQATSEQRRAMNSTAPRHTLRFSLRIVSLSLTKASRTPKTSSIAVILTRLLYSLSPIHLAEYLLR